MTKSPDTIGMQWLRVFGANNLVVKRFKHVLDLMDDQTEGEIGTSGGVSPLAFFEMRGTEMPHLKRAVRLQGLASAWSDDLKKRMTGLVDIVVMETMQGIEPPVAPTSLAETHQRIVQQGSFMDRLCVAYGSGALVDNDGVVLHDQTKDLPLEAFYNIISALMAVAVNPAEGRVLRAVALHSYARLVASDLGYNMMATAHEAGANGIIAIADDDRSPVRLREMAFQALGVLAPTWTPHISLSPDVLANIPYVVAGVLPKAQNGALRFAAMLCYGVLYASGHIHASREPVREIRRLAVNAQNAFIARTAQELLDVIDEKD